MLGIYIQNNHQTPDRLPASSPSKFCLTQGVVVSAYLCLSLLTVYNSRSSPWSDIISGFEWVLSAAQSSGRPSIATISIGGIGTQAVDDAVTAVSRKSWIRPSFVDVDAVYLSLLTPEFMSRYACLYHLSLHRK